jgi:hypothetical protein
MDLVNPFDPASIDTEYKAGDDMLYVQYLQDNGNDMQAAYVFRRDVLTGDAKSDQATAAIKYQGQGVESAVQSGAPTWSLPTRTSIRTPSS